MTHFNTLTVTRTRFQAKPGVKILLSIALVGILSTACGKNRAGSYTGTESVSSQGSAASASTLNLVVTESGSDQVTGTYSSTGVAGTVSGTFTGTLNGESISNMVLTTAPQANTASYSPSMSPSMMNNCGATQYTGTLVLKDDKITGTLTSIQTAAAVTPTTNSYPQYAPQSGYGGYPTSYTGATGCVVTRSIDTTRLK
ncbi:MAG: hypothetical protein H7222_00230 [Methylotenera sp.]|nr:hypothetical protein [Oligoflexia bacterium]